MTDMLSVAQAAAAKGITRQAIYLAIKQDRLSSHVINGRLLVRRQDLDAYTPAAAVPGAGRPAKERLPL
jgi:hypothetical protein